MKLKGKNIGIGITGSHCTLEQIIPVIGELKKMGVKIYPIISPSVAMTDTRFGTSENWINLIEQAAGSGVMKSIVEVEPMGPQKLLDVMVIAPCTGNTLGKLAHGITDTAVLMASKAQLRNEKPLVIAVSTNDALGINAMSLAILMNIKNVYMVPFIQDDPHEKPNSLVSRMELIVPAIISALKGRQLQPVFACLETSYQ